MIISLEQYFVDLKPKIDDEEVQNVLSLSLFQPTPESIARVIERCKKNDERKLWGITMGGKVSAVVEYYLRGDSIYIAQLAVSQGLRGQGIGRRIITELIKRYQMPIELETDDDAIGFYRKCGFQVTQFEKNSVNRWKCIL